MGSRIRERLGSIYKLQKITLSNPFVNKDQLLQNFLVTVKRTAVHQAWGSWKLIILQMELANKILQTQTNSIKYVLIGPIPSHFRHNICSCISRNFKFSAKSKMRSIRESYFSFKKRIKLRLFQTEKFQAFIQ